MLSVAQSITSEVRWKPVSSCPESCPELLVRQKESCLDWKFNLFETHFWNGKFCCCVSYFFFSFCIPILSLPEPSASAKDIVFVFTKEGKLNEPCVSSDGEWHSNQHLQNKQIAEALAEGSILPLLVAVECMCTKKHLSEKSISWCWITETHSIRTSVLKLSWD